MSQQLGGQQILILKEGSTRTRGRDAQGMNITAAKAVASAVRTTLGPKGMDKMLVDTIGDVVITNDGVTILKEMDIEHPAAKMMVEVAKTQDDEVGDGTTTAVVIAGELLKKAEDLLEQDVHPTIIAAGYRQAAEKAQALLKDLAFDVKSTDKALLKNIAGTAMTGKGAEASKDKLCDLVVRAVTMVTDDDGKVDIENIKVEKKSGGSIEDSEIVEGVLIDKERVHPSMPKKVVNAKILLLNAAVEFKKTEVDAEINITSPDQLQAFLDEEERMVKGIVDKIVARAVQTSSSARRALTILHSTTLQRQESLQPAVSRRATWRNSPGQPVQPSSPPSTRSARTSSARPDLLRSARSAAKR